MFNRIRIKIITCIYIIINESIGNGEGKLRYNSVLNNSKKNIPSSYIKPKENF